jgi:hypothetical protein
MWPSERDHPSRRKPLRLGNEVVPALRTVGLAAVVFLAPTGAAPSRAQQAAPTTSGRSFPHRLSGHSPNRQPRYNVGRPLSLLPSISLDNRLFCYETKQAIVFSMEAVKSKVRDFALDN